ncbi:DinB family protein [Deinococcus sp. QL22]|uniref:DinB family protein n=1 Tax=Deinococcus sp. QL22 TaxID=2939437 RepID=UPI0020176715|nr:DinB family protein [Deinococcus sp. QL22]UQN08639.1 DinB family protein [Deinococcus sp. QL22]
MPDLTLPLETFRRNARVNAVLLTALTPTDFGLSDERGGWTVGKHLAHMAGFRADWLSNISPAHAEPLFRVVDDTFVWRWEGQDPADLGEAFALSDEAALRAVQGALEKNQPFADPWNESTYQSNPVHFLMHTVVHDSHHRGQIMALLRLGGHTPEQMDALDNHWAIWRE